MSPSCLGSAHKLRSLIRYAAEEPLAVDFDELILYRLQIASFTRRVLRALPKRDAVSVSGVTERCKGRDKLASIAPILPRVSRVSATSPAKI